MTQVEKSYLTKYFQNKVDNAIAENQKAGKAGNHKDAEYWCEILAYTEQIAFDLGIEVSEDNAALY